MHLRLFNRRFRNSRLAEQAKVLVKLSSQIKQEFENDLSNDTRPFHFATGVTTLIYQLGKPLRQLRKQYPKAQIRVTVSVTEETVAGLHDRRFDLGLVSLPVPEENLKIIPLFNEELLIAAPSTNKARRGHISSMRAADLAKVPFLLYPRGTVLRVLIDRFFKEISVSPQVVMEAEDTEAIKRLVESGFGYSIIPEHALRQRTPFVQTYRVDGHPITRGLALAMVRTDYPRKLTVSIAESLRAMLTA